MSRLLTSLAIGFVSGLLSGAFGIGGGIITTPAIKLVLGAGDLIAVGTPLPVILPSAVTGVVNYRRGGLLDMRVALWCGAFGSAFAVLGAIATRWVGGTVVLLATATLILYTAVDMILQVVRPPRLGLEGSEERDAFVTEKAPAPLRAPAQASARIWQLAIIGALTGSYSGFLGLGGGFVLVPMLTRWLRFDIKRAIGTSLAAIAILAVPGTLTHAYLGHIDWAIAALLTLGVVPGAWEGSRITLGSSDHAVRVGFAVLLLAVGAWLAVAELGWIPR
jgi:uncharacterized membrane protein YfcA